MANVIKTVLTYQLDGSTRDFNIPFEYLARKFVVVTLIGVDRKVLTLNTDYRFATRTTISLTKSWGPADGYTTIELRRVTSTTDRLVDFTDGSILRAYDLNVAQIQTMHVAEEARDLTADTIGVNNDGHLDARGRRIVNLANAVDDRDAVPLGQLKTMNQNSWQARNEALQFRNEAETFRNQADGFKNESSTHATNAKQWRDEANEFRNEAEQFKNTSGQYAASAGSYAGNAKDSEDEARRIAESIKASARIGYVTRRSFEKGFNVITWNEVLLWEEEGEYYRWDGTLPKNIPAGSTPETSGGIGLGKWVSVGDASIRTDLTKHGATIDQIAHRATTIKSFEEFGAIGDGVTNDTSAMLAALSWLEGVPFGKLTGRVGAKYRIQQSLVMKFDGSYTQDVTSTRYIDFTGTTIVAGASGITCLRMSHDFCIVTNPAVVNPDGFTEVVAYAISPEDPTQTTTRVSQQFCQLNNPKATDVSVGVLLQPGPTISGANSGAYYHTIKNPVFENVDCGFRFNRSVSGDNSNTRITIYNPVHVTGNCAFWIESTDSLRVFGGSCENITKTTGPADVPCAVRVVKTVNSDTSVAGNLHFYGYFGELCTRGYQIDDNVGTYNNFFDWGWVYLDQEPYRGGYTHSSIAEFDGAVVSSNWDPNQPNISGCRRRKSGKQAVIIQRDDTSTAELYSDTKWKFTSSVIDAPIQDLRNDNSEIQLLGATNAGILLTTTTGTKGVTLESYDGKTSTGNPNGDLKIRGYNGVLPYADNTTVLGYTSNRWSVVYAATGTISTSDETLKVKTPATNESAEREAANEIRKNIIRYKFTDAVELKGKESARVHFGVGAQTVGSILTKHGLKPEDYAFWCKDEWEESSERSINPETLEEVVTVKPSGVRYGIRYDELIMFLMLYAD